MKSLQNQSSKYNLIIKNQSITQSKMKNSKLQVSLLKVILGISLNVLCFNVHSQEQKMTTIIQLEQYVANAKNASKALKPLRVENLINEIQSAVYLESDGVKSYGLRPVSLFTSIKNLSKINNPDIKKENIEIVNIRISNFDELNSNLDLSIFSGFSKLKYIYLISDIKCNEFDIKQMVKNTNSYVVLYKIADRS